MIIQFWVVADGKISIMEIVGKSFVFCQNQLVSVL